MRYAMLDEGVDSVDELIDAAKSTTKAGAQILGRVFWFVVGRKKLSRKSARGRRRVFTANVRVQTGAKDRILAVG